MWTASDVPHYTSHYATIKNPVFDKTKVQMNEFTALANGFELLIGIGEPLIVFKNFITHLIMDTLDYGCGDLISTILTIFLLPAFHNGVGLANCCSESMVTMYCNLRLFYSELQLWFEIASGKDAETPKFYCIRHTVLRVT
jgi:hypothetical protein